MDLLNLAFQSFWHFIGVFLLITIPFRFVISLLRTLGDWHIARKHGWRPKGAKSLKEKEDENENDD